MPDLLIKNARIIDGSGNKAYWGHVVIQDGRIREILKESGRFNDADPSGHPQTCGLPEAAQILDAHGHVLCPGFIDAHSHGDLILGTESHRLFKTTEGVTTEVTGQCSLSMAPNSPEHLEDNKNMLTMGTNVFPAEMGEWTTFSKYLDYVERQKLTVNEKMLVGHSALRIAVMGMDNRKPTASELDRMKGLLREAMEAGAAGLSTGLIYTPCCYSDAEEITGLAKVIEPFGGIYASHMRNESVHVVDAVKETIDVGRRAGVLVDISHHKMLGRPSWGLQKETLALIHAAWDEGVRVICDQYPYECCMTTLNACMPPWYFDNGFDWMTQKLKDPDFRAKLRREMSDPETPYDNYYLNAGGWDGVFVTLSNAEKEAEGLFISEYAEKIGKDPFDAFFDLCAANNCHTSGVYHSMCEEDLIEIFKDPYCVVGSDSLTRSWDEKGHPRASGTFPHVITYFVKEKGIVSLEEAIRKMTGLTAHYLNLPHKGLIREGYDADLVLFDPDSLRDTATYANPNSITEGIDAVLVNGQIVYKDMQFTGICSGRLLRA